MKFEDRTMTMISKLSTELVEEILSRVPMTSTRSVRCTCRNWNTICKDVTFTNKHLAQTTSKGEILTVVMMNCSLHLMRVNLQRGTDPTIKTTGKLISFDDSYQVVVSRVCHCDGLLLCTTEAYSWLAVWNPFTGHTRWISVEPTSVHHRKLWYSHALGYEKGKSGRVYKILRFSGYVHEIYVLKNSDSWRVLDVRQDWVIDYDNHGVSLKGDAYWYAKGAGVVGFLLCFDFTRERFGPCLPLPFECFSDDAVILSCVREEQLAVLFQHRETFEMEVWVTTKVEPNDVSWSMFFIVDMAPLTGFRFYTGGSFIIDEESAAVVVFDEDKNVEKPTRNTAYIVGFGESSYFREVDLGKITTGKEGFPHACSYLPSSVQIN
ncbi:hypothetical protein N665_0620s0017 [Sinapis alba]|nr:hypothetical protein N665_0620s0017 [Sinapis alba]